MKLKKWKLPLKDDFYSLLAWCKIEDPTDGKTKFALLLAVTEPDRDRAAISR